MGKRKAVGCSATFRKRTSIDTRLERAIGVVSNEIVLMELRLSLAQVTDYAGETDVNDAFPICALLQAADVRAADNIAIQSGLASRRNNPAVKLTVCSPLETPRASSPTSPVEPTTKRKKSIARSIKEKSQPGRLGTGRVLNILPLGHVDVDLQQF
ncbi:hypothetical protein NDU88_010038 [Pleurodeles waltl]|uniref:Uncharacterized protein n=1 Tax=Pleurodeles waltl TaxID=8319 RepID=A0AAV7PXN9_PLEWA|nr:hypothetical protein NDU88_010038 [Pleurodeles waltl]